VEGESDGPPARLKPAGGEDDSRGQKGQPGRRPENGLEKSGGRRSRWRLWTRKRPANIVTAIPGNRKNSYFPSGLRNRPSILFSAEGAR